MDHKHTIEVYPMVLEVMMWIIFLIENEHAYFTQKMDKQMSTFCISFKKDEKYNNSKC